MNGKRGGGATFYNRCRCFFFFFFFGNFYKVGIFVFVFLFLHHVMNGYFLNFFLLFLILVLKYNEELSLELCQIFLIKYLNFNN
jgi:hypothetical protein